jgi:Ca-activated chloride channel family protein
MYIDRAGEVSVVVELPPGVTPEASNFRLLLDGKTVTAAREVKIFQDSNLGLALLFCVDVSGTMKGDPLADTKKALLSFLATARPQDRIALISFADEDKIESSFEQERKHLEEAVRNLQTRGRLTRLYEALYKSMDKLQDAKLPRRRRLIVITDGTDEGSSVAPANVINMSKASSVPIDALGRGEIESNGMGKLRKVADNSGGQFVHAGPGILSITMQSLRSTGICWKHVQ